MRSVVASLLTLLVALFLSTEHSSAADVDPAPPIVNKLAPLPAAALKKHESVTFHAAPKPLANGAKTSNWPCFLGPDHAAVSSETKLLKKFPKGGPARVWELETGNGYASASIAGDYLVYSHRVRDEVFVECLHPATGEQYWRFTYDTTYQDRYGYSDGPRASAVIDQNRVYLLGVEGQFFCLELTTGRVIWQRSINKEFGVKQDFFGTVGTPLLEGDRLIINVGAPGGPCVAAFDKLTGRILWTAGDKWGPSYASPIPATIHGQRRVFVFAGGDSDPATGGLLSVSPATGAIDFEFPWRSTKYESVNAMCPVVIDDQVFISATYRRGSALLKIGQDFKPQTVWTLGDRERNDDSNGNGVGIHWNTPVVDGGYLYAFDGRNEPDASMVCVDLKAGAVQWRDIPEWDESVEFNGQTQKVTLSTMRGSFLKVDGSYLCVGELGHLMWYDLSPEGPTLLARCWPFFSRETWAPPVISRGLLYMTQNQRDPLTGKRASLICFDLRAAE
jgi:outer membrane protein assembly factor BamB